MVYVGCSGDMSRAALGDIPADTVIQGCTLVSVYTNEMIPDTDIAIFGSRISYVGPDASHTIGDGTRVIRARGNYAAPGLADPHTHLDQYLMPSQISAVVLAHGTTTMFSDPIDITGVCGYDGFKWFSDVCARAPVRIFQAIPGGQPVDPGLSHLSGLKDSQIQEALGSDDVFGVGEVFAWTKVIRGDGPTLEAIDRAREAGMVVNGHTAGMAGRKLAAYAASGIMSCHEPIDFDQTMERLRLGMHVMVREGSIRRDLHNIMREVSSRNVYTGRLMFCSDGLNPIDVGTGHLDHCVREAIRAGVDPVEAVSMASRNVFSYYMMDSVLGGIGPGRLADILLLDDIESFHVNTVMVGGKLQVADRVLQYKPVSETIPANMSRTVTLGRLGSEDFEMRTALGGEVRLNTIRLRTEIITAPGSIDACAQDGVVKAPPEVWKVAAFDRIGNTGNRALGFLEGFGDGQGAVATTFTLHENDLVVIGTHNADMAAAANRVIDMQGGTAVVQSGRISASLPMPVAGLISAEDAAIVRDKFADVNGALRDMGCKFSNPYHVPLFLPFLALPQIRILNRGVINVKERCVVSVVTQF